MSDERLIEEAAKAMHSDDLERKRANESFESMNSEALTWYRDNARAALAVFEKAHTPTDDEREALASIIDEIDAGWLMGEDRPPYPNELAEELVRRGVGFRRSEPEPSGLDGLARHWRAEPQGEPSDAAVDAALAEFCARINYKIQPTRGIMRAALRAASESGGEGR